MENSTLNSEFKNLASFSKEILVECPHCQKKAIVIADFGKYYVPYPHRFKCSFRCNNCFKPLDESKWYGPVNIYPRYDKCPVCGVTVIPTGKIDRSAEKIIAKCPNCKTENDIEVRYELAYANSHQATDPYLGLQLWLQIPVDQNIFWAYNSSHLEYLKTYISAKLRTPVEGGKYALAWKLPNFIKVAKNRNRLLKAIDKLERKLLE
jgi:hypothetical protein